MFAPVAANAAAVSAPKATHTAVKPLDPKPLIVGPNDTRVHTLKGKDLCEDKKLKKCTITVTFQRTKPKLVKKLSAADKALVSSDGVTLGEAAAKGGAIWVYDWWQKSQSILHGVAWTEKHQGRVYHDNNHSWIRKHRGYAGNHRCGLGRGTGYSIKVTYCAVDGDYSRVMDLTDHFQVHFIFKGFPIWKSFCMYARAVPNGSMTYKWKC